MKSWADQRWSGNSCRRASCRWGRRMAGATGLCVLLLAASTAAAAPPKIAALTLRGLQAGGTTHITIRGAALLPEPRLVLDLPVASQTVTGTPRADLVEFDVTLAAAVEPGVYNLRLSTAEGITGPELVTIDRLPQRLAAAANQVESLPVALHGVAQGAVVQESKFAGHKGEAIVVDVLARRFGSKLRPVVHLYDSSRRQLAWSLPSTELSGDARLALQLPADDTYTVAVHDLTYAGQAPGYYRLAIGQLDYVDQVFPPVISRQNSLGLDLIGKFGAQPAQRLDAGAVAQHLSSVGTTAGDYRLLAWPAGSTPVGLRPYVTWSDAAELAEGQSLDASRQLPALPVAVSGRLGEAGEADVYFVDVAEGEKLRAEVFADRIGSPVDAVVEARDAKGARLAVNDDAAGPDPRLDYVVPKGTARLGIAVLDANRRGGVHCIYRLVVSRSDALPPPGFTLGIFEDTHLVPSDGSKVLRVAAERVNYDGPIALSVEGLPAGFSAPPVEIPARAAGALVEIRRAAGGEPAGAGPCGRIVIRGKSVPAALPAGHAEIVGTAELTGHPLAHLQPWMKYDLAVAGTRSPVAFSAAWGDVPAEPVAYLGLETTLPVRLQRGPGANGVVRLSLLASQVGTAVNGQVNPQTLIRGTVATRDIPLDAGVKAAIDKLAQAEKALADAEKKLSDAEKKRAKDAEADPQLTAQVMAATAKRDEAASQLREAEGKVKPTAEYTVQVPADLPAGSYDLAIKAELRSADNQAAVVDAFTPPRRFSIGAPLELIAAETPQEGVTLDPKTGATITLTGTVKRLAGYAGDVTLTLNGLPAGIPVPRVVLKPADEKYELAVKLPANFAGEALASLQLVATLPSEKARPASLAKLEHPLPAFRIQRPTPPGEPQAAGSPPPATASPAAK